MFEKLVLCQHGVERRCIVRCTEDVLVCRISDICMQKETNASSLVESVKNALQLHHSSPYQPSRIQTAWTDRGHYCDLLDQQ